jgi:hypothetical protein
MTRDEIHAFSLPQQGQVCKVGQVSGVGKTGVKGPRPKTGDLLF